MAVVTPLRRALVTLFCGIVLWNVWVEANKKAHSHSHHRSPLSLIQVANIQQLPNPNHTNNNNNNNNKKALDNKTITSSPRISMSASPTTINNGDWVTVTYKGVSQPSNNDWIAVYSPASSFYLSATTAAPIKYQFANFSNPHYQFTGDGKLRFKMVNMHADFVFVLYGNGTEFPVYRQDSNICTFTNLEEPLQGHLSLTGNNNNNNNNNNNGVNEMRLGWATGYHTTQPQWVKWGKEPGVYAWSVSSTSYSYTADDMCGEPATSEGWRDPGLLHTAVMQNLSPGTRYYYIYGSDETGWSSEYNFRAAPVTQSNAEVTLIAYGDMGKGEEDHTIDHWPFQDPSLNTTRQVIEQIDEIDLVLHIGDISYAVGYSSEWDTFMSQVLPITTRVPYMTSPGNHERDYPNSGSFYNGTDSGGECGVAYERRFIMPPPSSDHILHKITNSNTNNNNAGDGHEEEKEDVEDVKDDTPWYSFDYGNIHIVMMSTEHDFTVNSKQYNWIQQDLRSVDRAATPWVIFTGHRPMYIDSTNNESRAADQPVAALLRATIEPLLVKYHVNVAMWGHHHSYQRTCPVYQQQCQKSADYPVHVVIGMAGFRLSQNLEPDTPSWINYVDDMDYGYSRIHTTMYQLHFQYFTNTGVLKDEFTLTQ